MCETNTPTKIAANFAQGNANLRLPNWAVALLNCPGLQEVIWFEPTPPRPFNPKMGLLTILREARKLWILDIENEGELLDVVIEKPKDLEQIK